MKYNIRDKLFRVYEVKNEAVVDYFDDAFIYDTYGIASFLIRYNENNSTKYYSIPQFNRSQGKLKIKSIK